MIMKRQASIAMTHRLQWSPSGSYFHGSETPEEKLPLRRTLGCYFTRQPKHVLEGIATASSGKKMRHRSDRDARKKALLLAYQPV